MKKKAYKKYKSDLSYIIKKVIAKVDEYIERTRKLLKRDFPHYPDSYIENLVQRDCMYLIKLKEFILTELIKDYSSDKSKDETDYYGTPI